MPHFSLEYSANMEDITDIAELCDVIRKSAIETGVFPQAGIRVRAMRADHVSIADGDPQNGFIDISIRLRAGRDLAVRKTATTAIFRAAEIFLTPVLKTHPIALSLEMRDIDPGLSPKLNTIRNHLRGNRADV
ncbi:MAG: 5-carboxymethyl-2-hydroxymuconate Delta-isomerase [Hyphomicrobiales bacterium]|nr:5-carboxymethyl-2-hydroxymuconate Delta-isomerase [Hyphomicrobiales bacterium]